MQKLQQWCFGHLLSNHRLLNLVWLIFRIHVGISIAIHAGLPKMMDITAPGWFSEQVAGLGFTFPSPMFWATVAAWGEFVGGLMIAFGFLTRLASLQLAFQFFIVAFFWYDEPEFFTGMYYQQLLFWVFLLIGIIGGGEYAIDKKISQRQNQKSTPSSKIISLLAIMVFTTSASLSGQSKVNNTTDLIQLEKDLKSLSIDKIKVNGLINQIEINLGKPHKINGVNEVAMLEKFSMAIEGEYLIIKPFVQVNYDEGPGIRLVLFFPEISVLESAMTGDIYINNFVGRYLRVNNNINANIYIQGRICDELELSIQSNGNIDASGLLSRVAKVFNSRQGNILLNTEKLVFLEESYQTGITNVAKNKTLHKRSSQW